MNRRLKYLYCFIVSMLTIWLPDWKPMMRFRGWLLKPAFKMVGRNFQVANRVTFINSWNINIGDNVYIATGCWLQGMGEINIADEVMLAPYCVVVTTQHSMKDGSYRWAEKPSKPVYIGFGTWLGAKVIVLPGVSIGNSVVCGAGTVISKDIEPYRRVVGTPVREV